MNKKILHLIFCLVANNCFAIDYYSTGDSLWVWAKGGLNIRAMPNDTATVSIFNRRVLNLCPYDENGNR